jgi:hypothetical protein
VPGVAPKVAVSGPKPRSRQHATGRVGDGLGSAVSRVGSALILQNAAAVDQVALSELREPVKEVNLGGRQILVSDRALMAADDSIVVISNKAVADRPLMELCPDKGRRYRELGPAGADLNRKPYGVEDSVNGITRQADDEKGKSPDVVPAAQSDLFDKLLNLDRLAVDSLLDLRIRAFDAEIDPGTARPRHNRYRWLLQAIDARFASPFDAQTPSKDFFADRDNSLLVEREHRIPEQDIFDMKVADEVLHLVDDIAG